LLLSFWIGLTFSASSGSLTSPPEGRQSKLSIVPSAMARWSAFGCM
jgi:hypothetical protein